MIELSPAVGAVIGGILFLLVLGVAVMVGLYVAERKKSEILENVATYGRPERPRAEDITPPDPEMEAKKRAEQKVLRRQVDRLADEVQERMKKKGNPISREEAEHEARELLRDAHEKAGGSQ